jgi:hypothetical protein
MTGIENHQELVVHRLGIVESGSRKDLKCVVCGLSSVVCRLWSVVCGLCQLIPMYVVHFFTKILYSTILLGM